MNIEELKSVTQAIVAKQKGVLAADETVVMDDVVIVPVATAPDSVNRVSNVVPQCDVVGQDQYLPRVASVGIDRALREDGCLAATCHSLNFCEAWLAHGQRLLPRIERCHPPLILSVLRRPQSACEIRVDFWGEKWVLAQIVKHTNFFDDIVHSPGHLEVALKLVLCAGAPIHPLVVFDLADVHSALI